MAGTIDFPDSPPRAFAIFAHCFAGSRQTPGAARTSKRLTEYGIATLRFDFPGLGQSEGDFAHTSFSHNVEDIKAAAEWLSTNYAPPQLLMGHSLGGAASLAAAGGIKSLKAVATIGAPFDPAHSVLHYADKISEADAEGAVQVTLGGQTLTISREFLENLADTNPMTYLRNLRKPLMLLHSPIDQTVGIDNAQKIFQATRYPKSLVSLDKADHLVVKPGTAARAADLIGAWVEQFLVPLHEPAEVPSTATDSHRARGTRYGVVVNNNNRQLTSDRQKSEGGKGQGFTPMGLVLSALTAETSQSIAEAGKAMAIDDIHVSITQPAPGRIERRVTVVADIDESQAAQLREAIGSGAVQAHLSGLDIIDVHFTVTEAHK